MEEPTFKKKIFSKASIIWVAGFIIITVLILVSDISFGPVPKGIVILFVFLVFAYQFLKLNSLFYLGERARYKDSQRKEQSLR